MKLKFQVFLLIIVVALSCKSKHEDLRLSKEVNYIPYYLTVYKADSLFLTGNYQKTYNILDSLFRHYKPLEIQGYYEYSNYVISAVLSGNKKNIKEIAKKAYINNGGLYSQQIKIVTKLDSIENVIGFSVKQRNVFKGIYNSNLNNRLRALVDKTFNEDQSVRAKNYKGDEDLKAMTKFHEPIIKKIFEKYGYPSTRKIGFGNSLKAVFIHSDIEFAENYLLPILLDYVKKGEDTPEIYSDTYDKMFLYRNSGYYYNTKSSVFQGKKLDSVRSSIGLPDKKYFRWRNKIIYDEYKTNKF